MKWPICGIKLSLCCAITSIWGVIQFLLLGIFFYIQAAPLLDDFQIDNKNFTNTNEFATTLQQAFHQRAYNCWIAAGLYVALLIFTGIQFMKNLQLMSTPAVPPTITSPFAGVTTEANGNGQQYGVQFNTEQSET